MNILSNSDLSISIKETGAELCSILDKKLNLEYLWQGDSSVWGRRSPVLFPIVGRLKENFFLFKGEKYSLPQHGFARDCPFTIISNQTDKIVFSLGYTDETLERFPFKFELQVGYQLFGRKLTVTYKVVNHDSDELFFSIGAHPGFRCPLNDDENYEDYFLEFSRPENLDLHLLKEGLISNEKVAYLTNEKKIPLSYSLFHNDALIFENYKSESISLKHKERGEIFKFYFAGYPYLGIWSKPGPFVCIEPWYGLADFIDHDGTLENKTGIQLLHSGETFECEWSVEFN